MGEVTSRLSPRRKLVVLTGPESSGKTTLLHQIAALEATPRIPLIGLLETTEFRSLLVVVADYDLERGQSVFRMRCMQEAAALLFVTDCSARDSVDSAKAALHCILEELAPGLPLLVCANKADIEDSMNTTEVVEGLNLRSIRGRNWRVERTSATSPDSARQGLEWLQRVVN